jgi:hypothetical protein
MTVNTTFDARSLPDGTLLVLNVRYQAHVDQRTDPTIYQHAAIKTRGRWWITGSGPQDAGWGAVERWLSRDGRELVSVEVATTQTIWPEPDQD